MKTRYLALYAAMNLIANAVLAADADKLQIHENPTRQIADQAVTLSGEAIDLGASDAKLRVVNFWALWCAPCRKELPTLASLDRAFADNELNVIAIATGRNDVQKIDAFMTEIGAETLEVVLDPKQEIARKMGVVALPHTVFLDSQGREIARLIGEANFMEPEMIEQIRFILEGME